MSEPVVNLVGHLGDSDMVGYIRAVADRYGRGKISEIVVISHNRIHYSYEQRGSWEDRWRLGGAIENAKTHAIAEQ